MLKRNSDNIVLSEVGANGSEALADLVGLVGLAYHIEARIAIDMH
jgi:hypothetical protein